MTTARMTSTDADRPVSFIEDLDIRQNEVIRELDRLNERIERLLGDWSTSQRESD